MIRSVVGNDHDHESIALIIDAIKERIGSHGCFNARQRVLKATTTKWRLIGLVAKFLWKTGLSRSGLTTALACGPGSTALHVAAKLGDVVAVVQLLQAGANPEQRDGLGMTALEVSRLHGPFTLVEAALRAAQKHT